MDSAASSLLSICTLLSEGAALTVALHLGLSPSKAQTAMFASFLAHPSCFPYPGILIFQP